MSDKTNVPGMENHRQNYGYSNSMTNVDPMPSFTAPFNGTQSGAFNNNVTVVSVKEEVNDSRPQDPVHVHHNSGKPIFGFLYSVSRIPTGEYWPLYQGSNIIGRDSSCDICLPEATVSRQHLSIIIRKNRNPEKVIAAIKDLGSTEGTMINGVSLDFEAVESKSGDVITVGQGYELLFILIDTSLYGLKPAEKFAPVNIPTMQHQTSIIQEQQFANANGIGATVPPSFRPESSSMYEPRMTPTDGTVGMDGGNVYKRGGTLS